MVIEIVTARRTQKLSWREVSGKFLGLEMKRREKTKVGSPIRMKTVFGLL